MIKKEYIPYNRQCIDEDDIQNVANSLRGDFLTTGPEVNLFEKDLASYTQAKYAVACSSGTAALHLSMQVLNVTQGDAVLTTPITFIADANVARLEGADVVFADIRNEDGNFDESSVRLALSKNPNIKVIILVHFAGNPIDMTVFGKIANEFNVLIVEDACHALGAKYIDKNGLLTNVGNCRHSIMSIFSFHPIKGITTGEGGAITTNDYNIYKKLLQLRSHGTTNDTNLFCNKDLAYSMVEGEIYPNPWYYEMHDLSYNYRISDFQCALGRSQLTKLDRFIERRNYLANIYHDSIEQIIPGKIIPLFSSKSDIHAYHLFIVKIDFSLIKGGRAAIMMYMKDFGIQTQVNYMPIYYHPYYQNYFKKLPVLDEAEDYYNKCLSLPIYPCMQDKDPQKIIEVLNDAITLYEK